jgi:hypothetical protein
LRRVIDERLLEVPTIVVGGQRGWLPVPFHGVTELYEGAHVAQVKIRIEQGAAEQIRRVRRVGKPEIAIRVGLDAFTKISADGEVVTPPATRLIDREDRIEPPICLFA